MEMFVTTRTLASGRAQLDRTPEQGTIQVILSVVDNQEANADE